VIVYPFPSTFAPARYSPSYLRSGVLEDQVQEACILRLQTRWKARVTVIDVGERRMRGRLARRFGHSSAMLRGIGGANERGIVDLAVTFPGGLAGWLEVKKPALYRTSPKTGRLIQRRPAGAPTPEQLAFLLAQHRLGAVAGVVWAPEDLDSLIPAAEVAA
jgi:hypothetical protein